MDIVKRLRDATTDWNGLQLADEETPMDFLQSRDLREAAGEIDRLRDETAALKYSLQLDEELIGMIQKIISILNSRPEPTPNAGVTGA